VSAPSRPLKGHSILIIDDDRLGAYRLHRALVAAGARVAHGDLAVAEPYLGAAALAAIVVATDLNETDAARLSPRLAASKVPWVAYGDAAAPSLPSAAPRVASGDMALLIAQLAAVCGGGRH
jgi:hypothetical protein